MKVELKQVHREVWHLMVDGEAIMNVSHGAYDERPLNIRVNPSFMQKSLWAISRTESCPFETYIQLVKVKKKVES